MADSLKRRTIFKGLLETEEKAAFIRVGVFLFGAETVCEAFHLLDRKEELQVEKSLDGFSVYEIRQRERTYRCTPWPHQCCDCGVMVMAGKNYLTALPLCVHVLAVTLLGSRFVELFYSEGGCG
ncbi:MAG: uncharacterized protein A8A55_0794 [Amphiamblys sp. WSBS2006]|nr:MAG: uncharacterized protein A8A55_0794 [Amphiamblys sp. WSBS2006]